MQTMVTLLSSFGFPARRSGHRGSALRRARRHFLVPLAVGLALPMGTGAAPDSETGADRPNVLFLIADDLSASRVGAYGDAAAHTPALDRLAEEGVLFERAYAAGTVCTPSRKSFLTGLDVRTVGWGNNNFLADHPETMTLPRWFREHGYQTAKVGKVQHGDQYEGPYDWDLNYNQTYDFPAGNAGKVRTKLVSADGKPVAVVDVRRDDQHSIDEGRTDAMIEFLEEGWDRSKPFFFALGYHAPHEPHEANRRHYEMHPAGDMPLVEEPPDATPMTVPYPPNFRHWSAQVPESVRRQALQGYYAAVTGMDEQVGRALDYLRANGLAEDTIVVFTSDQGYCLGYRDCWAKHLLYPPVLRVPLIVRYPGMPNRGAEAVGVVELLDIFPTLTELAGLPTPSGLHGKSLVPLIRDPGDPGKEAAYAQGILHRGDGTAVTTSDGLYLEWQDSGTREFYDLAVDPSAWVNRADAPAYADEVARHARLLDVEWDRAKPRLLVSYDFMAESIPAKTEPAVVAEGIDASAITETGDPDGGRSSPAPTNFSGASLNLKRSAVDPDGGNFSDFLEFSLEAMDGARLVAKALKLRFNSFSSGFGLTVFVDAGDGFVPAGSLGGADNADLANGTVRVVPEPAEPSARLVFRIEIHHENPVGPANTTLQIAEIGVEGFLVGGP